MRTRFFAPPSSATFAATTSMSTLFSSTRFSSTDGSTKSAWLSKRRILVTGANGQIGSEIIGRLREKYGRNQVLATDVFEPWGLRTAAPFRLLNAVDRSAIEKVVCAEDIGTILHLAAIMSVKGEERPHLCMELGIDACQHMFEVARLHNCRLYIPSSIAAFSPESGRDIQSDEVHQDPRTIYGITKVFNEKIGTYYNKKWGTDFRSLRYPGIISAATQPGGGTTDYAVWMYHYALQKRTYTCPVAADEKLPMMYMPDCLDATMTILEAPQESLHKCVYNVSAISLCPRMVEESIKKVIPDFKVVYQPGKAQEIASSWPDSMNDAAMRKDTGWSHKYDLDTMTADMLKEIQNMYKERGVFKLE